MAYMSTANAATIRANLAAAFPAKDGWKLSVKKSSGNLGIDVHIMASPVKLESWKFDSYGRVSTLAGQPYDDTPRTPQEAAARNMRQPMTGGDVNHYHFRDQHPPETVAVLEKLIGITMADHWDHSDVQSDYFSCAFYPHFGVGTWDKPCKMPA